MAKLKFVMRLRPWKTVTCEAELTFVVAATKLKEAEVTLCGLLEGVVKRTVGGELKVAGGAAGA